MGMLTRLIFRKPFQVARAAIMAEIQLYVRLKCPAGSRGGPSQASAASSLAVLWNPAPNGPCIALGDVEDELYRCAVWSSYEFNVRAAANLHEVIGRHWHQWRPSLVSRTLDHQLLTASVDIVIFRVPLAG